jgi:hypothetical protein
VSALPGGVFSGSSTMRLGRVRPQLTGNKTWAVIHLRLFAELESGHGGGNVTVRQVGLDVTGSLVGFTLSTTSGGTHASGSLVVFGERPEIEVVLFNGDGAKKAMIHSLVGYWQPGERP